MAARVLVEDEAVDRLAELGLTSRSSSGWSGGPTLRRACARALDPPIMEGLTRWGRTNRFLREELIPAGWRFDNPRNLPRTIHPSGEFAIVATTGDELTGLADLLPATKYAKGFATVPGCRDQRAADARLRRLRPRADAAGRRCRDMLTCSAVPRRRRGIPGRAVAAGRDR